jgi:hypothetical protein
MLPVWLTIMSGHWLFFAAAGLQAGREKINSHGFSI